MITKLASSFCKVKMKAGKWKWLSNKTAATVAIPFLSLPQQLIARVTLMLIEKQMWITESESDFQTNSRLRWNNPFLLLQQQLIATFIQLIESKSEKLKVIVKLNCSYSEYSLSSFAASTESESNCQTKQRLQWLFTFFLCCNNW